VLSRPLELHDAVMASAFFAGGIVLGVVLDLMIRRRLKRRGTLTTWGGDAIILAALRTAILVWFSAAGAAAAARALPLRPRWSDVIGTFLVSIVILVTTLALARLASDSVKLYSLRTAGAVRSSSIFVTLVRLGIFAVGLLVLLQTLGLSITPLLGALGIGGLAIALALQDTLSNLFAGLHVIASKKVRLGDFIRLEGGEEGYVIDINWRNTSIRTLTNAVIVVPNAKLANALIVNFFQPERETSVLVQISAGYDEDLDHVETVALDVARDVLWSTPGAVADFEPLVRFHTLGDFGINGTVVLRATDATQRFLLTHVFIKRLLAAFAREGIDVPYPTATIHIDNGDGRANTVRLDARRSGSRT
jgi:small-conductance mechanosensitive channel